MLVETKQRLEKLQKLLKAEKIQPVTAKRAAELFKKVFTTIQDPVKGLSKFRTKYPKYFTTITQEGTLSADGQKLKKYLEKTHKNLTEDLLTSSSELNKKAKTNLKAGTLFRLVERFNKGKKNKFVLRGKVGTSEIDPIYASSKKFKEYYDNLEDYPKFEEAKPYQKLNAHNSFLRRASSKIDPNFPLTTEEFVNKIGGIKAKTIPSYVISTGTRKSSVGDYIRENFKYKRRGSKELRWKEPSDTSIRQWNRFLNSRILKKSTVDNVQTLYNDKNIYKAIFKDKRLPTLGEVQTALNIKSPTSAAYSMSILARKLKGEQFKTPINIPLNVVAGKRILNQIGDLGTRDAYRTAFYNAALSNIDDYYRKQGATSLKQFKTDFNNELKSLLSLKKKQKVPFSVNEVIGISTGEMRGLQPYSAFVDITERNINEKALAQYQGKLSRKIGEIQDIFADRTLSEAEKVTRAQAKADKLKNTKGFKNLTEAQKASLGLAEIKIGTEIDPKIYSPEQLARYKKMGLDIQAMTDREGFYIDTKGRKPFFEVSEQSFKNTILKAARTNKGGVCEIFRAEGGRIGFAAGSSCVKQMELAFNNDPVKLSQDINKLPEQSGPINKVKNAATKFLTAIKENPNILKSRFGALAALGVGTVAAGVGAGALVKQFRNDDPSTYLTNDSQMEGMIIADVEQKGEEVDDNILLDNQFKLELAGAAALTAPIAKGVYQTARGVGEAGPLPEGVGRTRAALGLSKGVLGKGLWALGAPIVALPSTVGYIAQDVRAGKDAEEIATNPLNYLGAAFMNPAVKALGKAGASRGLLGIASLGLAGTAAAPLLPALSIGAGLATLGTLGYQGYKLFTGKDRSDEDFFR